MNTKTLLTVAAFVAVVFLGWCTVRSVKAINFKQDCGGYLARAANANTVELAIRELARALEYIERNDLTEGYTSVIYRTPDEDIGYWHDNLIASLTELQEIKPDASSLERSNVLMKLRETLMDQGGQGDHLTIPEGISVYPNNSAFAWWGTVSGLTMLGLFMVALVKETGSW